MIKFGPSGNADRFYAEGHMSTMEAPAWLAAMGLELYEYSFGRGINLSDEKAGEIAKEFAARGIEISAHAPYYVNFASADDVNVQKSYGYILQSAAKIRAMGGNRVIVHPGSHGKTTPQEAFALTLERLRSLEEKLSEKGFSDTLVCFETMGKSAQVGTVEEIIEICSLSNSFYPCIDFGHVNARERGSLNDPVGYTYTLLFKKLTDGLPFQKVRDMHVHFSKIQFGDKGEIKHLSFDDTVYGPPFEPLIDALIRYGLSPRIICESYGTQADDALAMKEYYLKSIQ
jgi:deoxyribonuclease-4